MSLCQSDSVVLLLVICMVQVKVRPMATVHEAARWNDLEALRTLLDEEPGLIEEEEDTWPSSQPLHAACDAGAVGAVRLLLDRGAAMDMVSALGHTPLLVACQASTRGGIHSFYRHLCIIIS